jgi:hypothetical protein
MEPLRRLPYRPINTALADIAEPGPNHKPGKVPAQHESLCCCHMLAKVQTSCLLTAAT